MADPKETTLAPARVTRDPFAALRQLTTELDRVFDEPFGFRWPAFRKVAWPEAGAWSPKVDVFERENRLVTRIDLPGVKPEEVKATFADGVLEVSVPLPARAEAKPKKVEIQEPAKAAKTAA